MKTILSLLFAILLSGCASMQPVQKQPPRVAVFNDGAVVAAIFDEPCTSEKVKPHVKPELFDRLKKGVVSLSGLGVFDLCWAPSPVFADVAPELPADSIFIIDEMGNYGPVPADRFKADPGQGKTSTKKAPKGSVSI